MATGRWIEGLYQVYFVLHGILSVYRYSTTNWTAVISVAFVRCEGSSTRTVHRGCLVAIRRGVAVEGDQIEN